jgi:hypothetical protein
MFGRILRLAIALLLIPAVLAGLSGRSVASVSFRADRMVPAGSAVVKSSDDDAGRTASSRHAKDSHAHRSGSRHHNSLRNYHSGSRAHHVVMSLPAFSAPRLALGRGVFAGGADDYESRSRDSALRPPSQPLHPL